MLLGKTLYLLTVPIYIQEYKMVTMWTVREIWQTSRGNLFIYLLLRLQNNRIVLYLTNKEWDLEINNFISWSIGVTQWSECIEKTKAMLHDILVSRTHWNDSTHLLKSQYNVIEFINNIISDVCVGVCIFWNSQAFNFGSTIFYEE